MKKLLTLSVLLAVVAGTTVAQEFIWSTSYSSGAIFAHDTSGNLKFTTVSTLGTVAQPRGVAIGAEGTYIAMLGGGSGGVHHVNESGSINTFYAVGNQPFGIAFDSNQNIYVTDSASNAMYVMTSVGVVQSTVALPSAAQYIAVNSFNEIFVDATTTGLLQMTTSGTVIRTIAAPGGSATPTGFAVDRSGHCWVAFQSGHLVKINRTTGAFDVNLSGLPMPTGVAVNNFDEVYVANGDAQGQLIYMTSGGQVNTSVNAGTPLHGVALDGNGDVWVTSNSTPASVLKFDRWTLSPLNSISHGTGNNNSIQAGDFIGYHQANILGPTADFDSDSVTNLAETNAGSNPFVAGSTPTNPQPILNAVARPGASVTMSFRQYGDALLGYAAGGSQGNTPANYIPVPGTQLMIPLENDAFYSFVANNFWHFQNFGGNLDANGNAIGQINVPNNGALIGQNFYFAFITLNSSSSQPVTTVSNNVQVTVQP